MIKDKPLPKYIDSLLPKAFAYLQERPDILFAYLFGGLARGKRLPLSDVDIAIYFSKGANPAAMKMDILGELTTMLQTDEIDLVVLNTASLPLKMRIVQKKKTIVARDPFARHRYESLTMRSYFDFAKKEMDILERRFFKGQVQKSDRAPIRQDRCGNCGGDFAERFGGFLSL
jgi:predicted nucleotidyltransferase